MVITLLFRLVQRTAMNHKKSADKLQRVPKIPNERVFMFANIYAVYICIADRYDIALQKSQILVLQLS
jgi:hypothetical protein